LQVLADKLCLDDDEWVKVTAYAVGRYEGHLDLAAVSKASRAVSALLCGASSSCMLDRVDSKTDMPACVFTVCQTSNKMQVVC